MKYTLTYRNEHGALCDDLGDGGYTLDQISNKIRLLLHINIKYHDFKIKAVTFRSTQFDT